ncbi:MULTISPECIES: flagellar basal body L-ring protein FlgH [unclassified Helicobacter]|uniref:flagellar basal body L-ring protein FlgH n=1 Tax=unclassified Helicobacter TaxID=2593540 RepID=UPI0009EE8088|nr:MULTISPECIES: flagellar basal body L-ring protein FlgH [unclassified Helicobacter]
MISKHASHIKNADCTKSTSYTKIAKPKRLSFTALFAGIFSSLITTSALAYDPQIDFNPPDYVEEMPSKEFLPAPAQAGSLFGQGERPLFADRRAMRPNDLITINIDESSNASLSSSKDYTKTSQGVTNPPNLAYNGENPETALATRELNDQTNYTLTKPNDNSTFKGSGQQSRNDALRFSITGRILKVLENGNYFVYGHSEVLIDGEKRLVTISGVIRPYDIERNNTISSKYISDSKIAYTSLGAIGQTNHKKPAAQALEDEYPF